MISPIKVFFVLSPGMDTFDLRSCVLGITSVFLVQFGWRILRSYLRPAPAIMAQAAKKLKADPRQDYKMVLLIRTDLEMSKGKVAAQCGHAVLAAYKQMLTDNPQVLQLWEECGQPKITLKVPDEKEMYLFPE